MPKKLIIAILIILIILLFIIANSKRSNENGNISNMGLVVTDNGVTYYNKYEEGIFGIKNGQEIQITDETAYSINVVDDKIYYISVEDFNNVAIKSVDTNGQNLKIIKTIYTTISKIYVDNGFIYYCTNETGKGIARVDLNGRNEEVLIPQTVQDFEIYNGEIYYVNNQNQICKKDNILNTEKIARKIQIVDKWIYYYNQSENALFRLSLDGQRNELVSVLINNETYNVSGKYVYYFDKENLKIARMQIGKSNKCDDVVDLSISKTKINIAEDELYYLDKSNNDSQSYQIFRVKVDGRRAENIQY